MSGDAEIVGRAVAGDRQAAADLIERHAAAVYAVCLGLLADPDRAEDVSQDALLRGISSLASLEDPGAFRGWLVAIARNLCRDAWQRSRRRRELLDQQVEAARAASGPGAVAAPGMGAAGDDANAEEDRDLEEALARLPEKYRLPLLLYYFDGLSTRRVAEALGIAQTGAATRLCRARRALRAILEVEHD
jgi:RNA polymerase sigma-70 factor (ECF subfamily)